MQTQHPITKLRNDLGWDRRKLAIETGVDVSTVSRWESNKVIPSSSAKVILDRLSKRAMAKTQPEKVAS